MTQLTAAGIQAIRVAGFEHDLFRCATWRATLSVPACAGRWREAQTARAERGEELRLCRQCHIGAAHAGERFIHRAAGFQSNVCPRCNRGSGRRLIGGKLCIGCYNRQLELLRGKNAKGTAPLKALGTLNLFRIGVRLDIGDPTERTVEYSDVAAGADELKRHVERTHEGLIEFVDSGAPGTYPAWQPAKIARNTALDAVAATSEIIFNAAKRGISPETWKTPRTQAATPTINTSIY